MSDEPHVTMRKQMGTIQVMVEGRLQKVPAELTIEETHWPDGRVDCTVKVPRIQTKTKTNIGA